VSILQIDYCFNAYLCVIQTERGYLKYLEGLAQHIDCPELIVALREFLHLYDYPDTNPQQIPNIDECPTFHGKIHVYHLVVARFYAPSDLCGAGGLHQQHICSTPSFYGMPRHDTVFVVLDESKPGMEGIVIACMLSFFSFCYCNQDFSCALVNWFIHTDDMPDKDTGMWIMELEHAQGGCPTFQVIELDTVARGAHLLPVYGANPLPPNFDYNNSLDSFSSFFVNHFIDHHGHEFVLG
jgi:hypothetical protein